MKYPWYAHERQECVAVEHALEKIRRVSLRSFPRDQPICISFLSIFSDTNWIQVLIPLELVVGGVGRNF